MTVVTRVWGLTPRGFDPQGRGRGRGKKKWTLGFGHGGVGVWPPGVGVGVKTKWTLGLRLGKGSKKIGGVGVWGIEGERYILESTPGGHTPDDRTASIPENHLVYMGKKPGSVISVSFITPPTVLFCNKRYLPVKKRV